ncbi:COG0714 MoxR-like ATPases [uncultured Caudovirales phage]|uniref:COG0714 MoxR-like ATPases n=1 Tax=uncultured Caudovirales phage TaxID=2100421 RepID=A0A6J5N7V4_9CAUD|nr:COG0714 MoxR-like ATPases [uncultured Caudovirales phage]
MTKLQAKFAQLGKDLNRCFGERKTVVDGMLCAALAGEHVLLLGPPGTAKSALTTAFCGQFGDASYFEWLLSKFTAPEELFGPISLEGIKKDVYRRVTTNKLPEAHIVFLDEIFKANSAILNSLLTAINERKFHNGGGVVQLPLEMVVGASNELPEGPELEALYDRFLVRFWVDYQVSAGAFQAMLVGSARMPAPTMSLDDWREAQAEVERVAFPQAMVDELFGLRAKLNKAGVVVSDRRWVKCVRLLKAAAWLAGDTDVDTEHLSILEAALWKEPGQAKQVSELVGQSSGGVVQQAMGIHELALSKLQNFPARPKDASEEAKWQTELVVVNRESNRALDQLRNLSKQAITPKKKERIEGLIDSIVGVFGPLREAARQSLGL